MTRQMPLWYVREQNVFETMTRDHPRIEVVRVPGGFVFLLIMEHLCHMVGGVAQWSVSG